MGTENSSNEYQEARQHLSLSATAWAVLQDDRQDFGGGRSWAGILNYVFAGFLLEFSCLASSLLHSIRLRILSSVVLDLRTRERV